MHVLIIGAAGMLGMRLASRLARDGALAGRTIERLTLSDIVEPVGPVGFAGLLHTAVVDLSDVDSAGTLVASRPDVIFHLAAIVSGEAEADLDKGYRINLDGTRNLFDAIRREASQNGGWCPRMVYSSSIAVFGTPFPDVIGDDFHLTPRTSYGVQKAMGELMLNDYTRRGILDGIGLRLPTICIRPGAPNKAASGFFSNILREPINGQSAVLPVPDTVRHWFASPRSAIGFLVHAATLAGERVGPHRNLNLPGLSATVADQIAALGRVAGTQAVTLIEHRPDPAIEAIVSNWAQAFDPQRANELGFVAERSFDEIIQVYLEDESER